MNSVNSTEKAQAELKWDNNINLYKQNLISLEKRLSKKVFNFLLKHCFHDFRIESINLLPDKKNKLIFSMILNNGADKWQLTYKGIQKLSFNYINEELYSRIQGFDNWGFDELLDKNDFALSHEIMCISGSMIYIEFLNKNLFLEQIR